MEKIIEKVKEIENDLDHDDRVIKIKKLNEEIMQDKKLLQMLEEYRKYPKEELKNEIINYPLFQNYKKEDLEINILIMEINEKLKKINDKGTCSL